MTLVRRTRGFVMVAVLIVVAAAILVATGAIFAARAAVSSSRASDVERRLRDAALDGVALAADLVVRDRAEILAGAAPRGEEVLLELPDGDQRLEVRLVPQPNGDFFESEAAKLDANTVAPEALLKAVDGTSELARDIVTAMSARRPLTSVDAAIALVPPAKGVDALREVLGPLAAIGDERERIEDGRGGGRGRDAAPPIVSLMTVLGAEPLVDPEGQPRLDLIAAFGDGEASQRSTASLDRFEDAEREVLEETARKSKDGADDGEIARALLGRGVDLARIDQILGSCTLQAGAYGVPRLDIVRADVRALSALDGLGPDAAARIVDLRGSLDETERRGTTWLISRRVLTPEQYGAVAGRITNRSALWRFRVEARFVNASDSNDDAPSSGAGESHAAYAFDCVVDVSPEQRRIAFLRDVSMLPSARLLAFRTRNAEEDARLPKTDPADLDRADESADDLAEVPPEPPPQIDSPPPVPTIVAPPPPGRAPRGRVSPTGRDIGGMQ